MWPTITVLRKQGLNAMKLHSPEDIQAMFPEHRRFGFTTTQGVGKAIRRASIRAGLSPADGHQLGRHAFAARWLSNGGSIKSLKEAGGWKTLKITDEIYGHLEQTPIHERMRELSRRKK